MSQDRLLSGFLDKMQLQRKADRAPAYFRPGGSFEEFVRNLTSLERPRLADIHFRPASRQCGLPFGMRYDYALKVEEMAEWYEPLVRLLGLEATVQSGWNRTTKWWRGSGECFYAPPGRRCADMFATPCGSAQPTATTAGGAGVRPASFHATGAAARRSQYFRGVAARLATRWLREDLERFGYDRIGDEEDEEEEGEEGEEGDDDDDDDDDGGDGVTVAEEGEEGAEEEEEGDDDDDDDGRQGKDEASDGGGGDGRPARRRWWSWW